MKQLLGLFLSLILTVTLCACGGKTPAPTAGPSVEQSVEQSTAPSVEPSVSVQPSAPESVEPSTAPTVEPSTAPTVEPPVGPSLDPDKSYAIFDALLPICIETVEPLEIDNDWVDERIDPIALPFGAEALPTPAQREGYTFLHWSTAQNGDPVTVQTLQETTVLYAVWQVDESFASVSSAEEFAAMQADGNYILTADITLTEGYAQEFSGTFYGNGHTVTLQLQSDNNVAMFQKLVRGAKIYNVQAQGSVVSGKTAAAIAIENYYGVIFRCSFNGKVQGSFGAGGIVYASTGHVSLCATQGEVIGDGLIGGICGTSDMSKFYYCASTVAIKNIKSATIAGGICADLVSVWFNTIHFLSRADFCYFGGTIEINGVKTSSSAGGIAGRSLAFVTDCYADCTITANEPFGTAGGLFGRRESKKAVYGELFQTVATRSYYAPTCTYTNYKNGVARPAKTFSDTDLLAPEGFVSSYFTYSPAALAFLSAN